jgi:pimeloyl-ACP methyl ester carboxylesterase
LKKLFVTIDVTDAVATGERLSIAATVVIPEEEARCNGIALFAYPGGHYNRGYYDIQLGEGPDYSQAEFHVRQGFVFVAIDHLGVGQSTVPERPLDYEAVARANNAAATEILRRLNDGTLDANVPNGTITTTVAMGQSFGGFLLTIAQGRDPLFDGVALLGWSGIQTQPPWSGDIALEDIHGLRAGNGLDHPMRTTFHLYDVPESIVIADMTRGEPLSPWGTKFSPGGPALIANRAPLDPGASAEEAAAITCPVFVGSGEVEVIADFRAEPAAYKSSQDVTTCKFSQMAHMHNFSTTRGALWLRLSAWASGVAAMKTAQ